MNPFQGLLNKTLKKSYQRMSCAAGGRPPPRRFLILELEEGGAQDFVSKSRGFMPRDGLDSGP